jgi:hypothetical protein
MHPSIEAQVLAPEKLSLGLDPWMAAVSDDVMCQLNAA